MGVKFMTLFPQRPGQEILFKIWYAANSYQLRTLITDIVFHATFSKPKGLQCYHHNSEYNIKGVKI